MLGGRIDDPDAVESGDRAAEGLGLLSVTTRFSPHKRTTQVRARPLTATFLSAAGSGEATGYEIHMGRLERAEGSAGPFVIHSRNAAATSDVDGAVSPDGAVVGTMIHGLFDNADVRRVLLATLRRRKGLSPVDPATEPAPPADEFDRLAAMLRERIDLSLLHRLCEP
jgi:adenosylcobyric acid synthase